MTTPAATSYPEDEPVLFGAPITGTTIVVPVEEVASRLGIAAADISDAQRTRITDAIIDAQAVVEGELGRTLVPETKTFTNVLPFAYAPYGLTDRTTWPILETIYDDVVITSTTAHPDGTFDVAVQIGLDGTQIEPIRAFIRAHATEAVRLDPSSGMGQLAVTSVSAEGQSISYEKRSSVEGAAGALPTLRSLRRWKKMSVYQHPTRVGAPWPYRTGLR